MGPGWGVSGDTDTRTGVLGETRSGAVGGGVQRPHLGPPWVRLVRGEAEVDSPTAEARTWAPLIDWVATRPGVELDAPGDPRMGMVGGLLRRRASSG